MEAGNNVIEFVGPPQCRQTFRWNTARKPLGIRGASASCLDCILDTALRIHRIHRSRTLAARLTVCQDGSH